MSLPSFQTLWLAVLFLGLICFSALGFRAMAKGSRGRITAFWVSIVVFLILLAAYLALYHGMLIALAPLIPAFLFARLCFLTLWAPSKKAQNSQETQENP